MVMSIQLQQPIIKSHLGMESKLISSHLIYIYGQCGHKLNQRDVEEFLVQNLIQSHHLIHSIYRHSMIHDLTKYPLLASPLINWFTYTYVHTCMNKTCHFHVYVHKTLIHKDSKLKKHEILLPLTWRRASPAVWVPPVQSRTGHTMPTCGHGSQSLLEAVPGGAAPGQGGQSECSHLCSTGEDKGPQATSAF